MTMKYSDFDEDYGRARYSFQDVEIYDSDIGDAIHITCRDRQYVEIEYSDGRRVRYLYNRNISERK